MALDIGESRALEGAALQPKPLYLHGNLHVHLRLVKRGDQLELIYSDRERPRRLLPESIEEGLWVKEVTQADRLVEQLVLLGTLNPSNHRYAFLAEDSEPGCWCLRAFPLLLPTCGDFSFQQRGGLRLYLRSKHLCAL